MVVYKAVCSVGRCSPASCTRVRSLSVLLSPCIRLCKPSFRAFSNWLAKHVWLFTKPSAALGGARRRHAHECAPCLCSSRLASGSVNPLSGHFRIGLLNTYGCLQSRLQRWAVLAGVMHTSALLVCAPLALHPAL